MLEVSKPFDVSKPFRANIGKDAEGKAIIASLRYPSDDDWESRARRHPAKKKIGERGSTKFLDTDTSEFDGELVRKLLIEGSPTIDDPYLAAKVINALDRSMVESIEPEGSNYRMTMVVYGVDKNQDDGKARTVHIMKAPTERQISRYNMKGVSSGSERRDRTITTVQVLDVGAKLYDELMVSTEGYAGAIPLNHKNAIIWELVEEASQANSVDDVPPEI